ncbi:TPA: hypothetical protein N0F65_012503 [Lagenidium giganteum]|uniref:PX domain-containing protein n=1 Tax=Lagenidium giganteum TaxID=4803 RepID=A0AAV2YP36_9STRA|nr:TPA: hypothetical protein N0F65_012503 [Lagenidium giganteum]
MAKVRAGGIVEEKTWTPRYLHFRAPLRGPHPTNLFRVPVNAAIRRCLCELGPRTGTFQLAQTRPRRARTTASARAAPTAEACNATANSRTNTQTTATATTATTTASMKVIAHHHRASESALPDKFSSEFMLGPEDVELDTRHSIVSFDPATKPNDGCATDYHGRDTLTTDESGVEPLQFWSLDDYDSSRLSNVTSTSFRHDPYQNISIEVTNHSIDKHGVVMYHVDIKGPEGLLSTYTIRRRFRAFKTLYQELVRLLGEYTAPPVSESAPGVPFSPHTQSRYRQQQQGGRVAGPPTAVPFEFPALPSAGVWSYLKRHDVRLVNQRKKRLQEILRLAIRHPATKNSAILDDFLSVAPSEISQRGSSYVSLHDYSVPVFDRERESIARKQRKQRLLEGRQQRTTPQAAVAPVPLVRSTSSPEPPSSSSSRSSSRIPSSVSSTSSSASANATSSTPSSYTDLAVNGYTIRGPEKKVVYHIDVIGNESQLQTYTIRRSYSEFKALHNGLADVLAARREYYLSQKRLSHVPENAAISTRASQGASRKSQQEDASHPSSIDDADAEAVINFTLPPLPHAGFLSFWRRHDRSHIASRCEMFQELLRAVMKIKVLRESFALQSFLSVAPCAIRQRGSSYVSLCEYSVPQLDPKEECEERKKLARERRRNSSAHSSFVQE